MIPQLEGDKTARGSFSWAPEFSALKGTARRDEKEGPFPSYDRGSNFIPQLPRAYGNDSSLCLFFCLPCACEFRALTIRGNGIVSFHPFVGEEPNEVTQAIGLSWAPDLSGWEESDLTIIS